MTETILVKGATGKIVTTLYKPADAAGAMSPVIVYYHGAGFVIANNAT